MYNERKCILFFWRFKVVPKIMKNHEFENGEYIEIGRRLYEFRKLNNLTQSDVEKRLGIKQETISMIESGNRKISALMLKKLCQLYGVTYEQVLGKNDSPKSSELMYHQKGDVPLNSVEFLLSLCRNSQSAELKDTVSKYIDLWAYCLIREIYEANPKNTNKIFSIKKDEAIKSVLSCLEKAPPQLSAYIKASSGSLKLKLIELPLEQAAGFREFIKYAENIILNNLIK